MTTLTDRLALEVKQATARLEVLADNHRQTAAARADAIRAMHAAGMTWRAIGRAVGLSAARCHAIASEKEKG